MERLHKTLILFMVAAIPAAAPAVFHSASPLCFTAGSLTYQLSSTVSSPDYRVKIDNQAARPGLRIGLVDRAERADFALVDDVAGFDGTACNGAGSVKTVKIVSDDGAADLTISLSRDAADPDFRLYVHSARVNHQQAAALFALMRHAQKDNKVAEYR